MPKFREGDPVLYRLPKCSPRPGPRAEHIQPAPQGELYRYLVVKFWRVKELREDGTLAVYTRRGKERVLHADDNRLMKPGPFARFLHKDRFPTPRGES